jgi:hypothetical protein
MAPDGAPLLGADAGAGAAAGSGSGGGGDPPDAAAPAAAAAAAAVPPPSPPPGPPPPGAGAAPIVISLRARGLMADRLAPPPPGARWGPRALGAAAAREASAQLAGLFCALIAAFIALPLWAWFSALLCSIAAVFFVASQSAALTDGLVVTFGIGAGGMLIYMAAAAIARRDRGAALLGQGAARGGGGGGARPAGRRHRVAGRRVWEAWEPARRRPYPGLARAG